MSAVGAAGATGSASFFLVSLLSALTIMKIAHAGIRKSIDACRKFPYVKTTPLSPGSVQTRSEKLTDPVIKLISGVMMSATSDDTIAPKPAPITTPTASCMAFPLIAKSLNS